ncbi:ankyrin repeat-containing protein [Acanthamoeba polyphaga mimivirus]|uniref:Ankyrin repeat-containing protein n=1 Tax=Acanthamoeba polyphaga mimivirus Kroon TaxID=3069720 RepID=A0A0G2Y7L6_9VIRU|nr:ankyrin repeat-containing protein [Acanthamoeba polyphaga mimivirus]AKI79812.1 ankyrin repeat-containing protein [Acanthamoeba polyphaga mimivirus Kroon]
MYYQLPPELWVKIINYSNEPCLLLTDKNFFELLYLVDIKVDVIEYIIENNLLDVLKYMVSLKKLSHPFFDKNIFTIESLNKCFKTSCKKGRLNVIKYLVDLDVDIRIDDDYAVGLASRYGQIEIV